MVKSFDFDTVEAGDFGPVVFPKGRYTVEVERADATTYKRADGSVGERFWVLFRLVDNESYNNRTSLASRSVTPSSMKAIKALMIHFSVAMPKASDSAKVMATAIAQAFNAAKGNKAAVFLKEEQELDESTGELQSQLVIQKLLK